MSRKNPLPVRSANTLRVPLTEGSAASIAVPIFSISAKSAPEIFSPTGVRIPVDLGELLDRTVAHLHQLLRLADRDPVVVGM